MKPLYPPPDEALDDNTTISDEEFSKNPFVLWFEHYDQKGRKTGRRRATETELNHFRKGSCGSCSWHPIINGVVIVKECEVSLNEEMQVLREIKQHLNEAGIKARISTDN